MKPFFISALAALLSAIAVPSCSREKQTDGGDAESGGQTEQAGHTGECCHADPAAKGTGTPPPPPETGALVKGEFNLTNVKTGGKAAKSSFDGSYRLVFFGFTHCRVICPTGLKLMADIARELDKQPGGPPELVSLFISIDPKRDSAERLAKYLAAFDTRIIGLRGDIGEVRQAMKSFRIEAPRTEVRSETDYQLDHPAIIMLMDRNGEYMKSIPSSGDPADLAGELMEAIRGDQATAEAGQELAR